MNLRFVNKIEQTVENKFIEKEKGLASKDDIMKLDLKISEVRLEIKESKVDIIKWGFAFFVTLALMILGLYIKK